MVINSGMKYQLFGKLDQQPQVLFGYKILSIITEFDDNIIFIVSFLFVMFFGVWYLFLM